MSVEQYWMGKGLDLDGLWRDFDNGSGYMQKVAASPLHLLRLTFADHPSRLPLFDLEVVFKTVKGTFHDVKAECLTERRRYKKPFSDFGLRRSSTPTAPCQSTRPGPACLPPPRHGERDGQALFDLSTTHGLCLTEEPSELLHRQPGFADQASKEPRPSSR
jgi:hypothetical protein